MSLITYGFGSSGGGGGGSGTVPTIESITPAERSLALVFNTNVALEGPAAVAANWLLTPTGSGVGAMVSEVLVDGNEVTLTVSEQSDGEEYALTIPVGILDSESGFGFLGPFTQTFTAVGAEPQIAMVRPVDGRHVEVIFTEPVEESSALDPANYSITPTLTVVSVRKLTAQNYLLTTSRQTPGESYTVTVSGIIDLVGN